MVQGTDLVGLLLVALPLKTSVGWPTISTEAAVMSTKPSLNLA